MFKNSEFNTDISNWDSSKNGDSAVSVAEKASNEKILSLAQKENQYIIEKLNQTSLNANLNIKKSTIEKVGNIRKKFFSPSDDLAKNHKKT